jgi:PPOX class probable F420-dependent enzyme
MELPRDAIEHLLDTWPVARLATLRPDGSPALVPVVFARSGGRLWLPVDGKPKRAPARGEAPELARVANVRRDGRVALLLDQYEADWTGLWWLRLDGAAEVVGEGAPGFGAALAALGKKYPQYLDTPALRPEAPPTLIVVSPLRTTSWAASPDVADFLS